MRDDVSCFYDLLCLKHLSMPLFELIRSSNFLVLGIVATFLDFDSLLSLGLESFEFDELLDLLTHWLAQDDTIVVLRISHVVSKGLAHLLEAVDVVVVKNKFIRNRVDGPQLKHDFERNSKCIVSSI